MEYLIGGLFIMVLIMGVSLIFISFKIFSLYKNITSLWINITETESFINSEINGVNENIDNKINEIYDMMDIDQDNKINDEIQESIISLQTALDDLDYEPIKNKKKKNK